MFKVSRKSEYALIAVQHLARRAPDGVTSVTELANAEEIQIDTLAKVLQGLKHAGLLTAVKGSAGGYRLSRPAHEIPFLDVIRPFEDQLSVATCTNDHGDCDRSSGCSLRGPMVILNAFVLRQFGSLKMDMFLEPPPHHHGAPPAQRTVHAPADE